MIVGRRFVMAAIATSLVACGSPTEPASPRDGGGQGDIPAALDATEEVDLAVDLPGDPDEPDGELDLSDAERDLPDPTLTSLIMSDGQTVRGELVATYDHSLWWDASDQLTYALFEPDGFFPYPNDHSFRFVSSWDVLEIELATEAAQRPYVDLMRQRNLMLELPPLDGISYVITAGERYHLEENGYGDYAWDLVRTDDTGERYFSGEGTRNEDHFVWDNPVFLPHAGEVVEVIRDAPDNTPGSYPDDAPENLVGIALGGSFTLYLLHFRQDTIPSEQDGSCEPATPGVPCVAVGAVLERGAYLGQVGNSGTSLEPHLHVVLLWYDSRATVPRSWSIPVEFANLYTTGDASPAVFHETIAPRSGVWISAGPF